MWYRLVCPNNQTLYGWTQNPDVVTAALAQLNARRGEYNQYWAEEISDSQDETDDGDQLLANRDDHVFNDDTRPEDFLMEETEETED